jgi:hypothetical protein
MKREVMPSGGSSLPLRKMKRNTFQDTRFVVCLSLLYLPGPLIVNVLAWCLWLTPVILATWESIRHITVWGQPWQIVCEAPISKTTRAKWIESVVQVNILKAWSPKLSPNLPTHTHTKRTSIVSDFQFPPFLRQRTLSSFRKSHHCHCFHLQ